MRTAIVLLGLALLSAGQIAASQVQLDPATRVLHRGVHSAVKEKLDHFYAVTPSCKFLGYPEITVVKPPMHGSAVAENRDDHPTYPESNVRSRCNKQLVASSQIFYDSYPNFHGRDTFRIKIVYPDGTLKSVAFVVDVL